MHHDTQPFRTLQEDAKRTADQLTAFIDQAITTDVHPPRLLADAAWELWEFARLTTPPEPDGQRWPETLEPSAGVRDMERRRFLAGVVASAGAVVSESAISPPSTATLARLQATTERFRQARVADATRGYLGPMLRHAQALDLAANRAHAALRRDLLVAHGDALTILAWFANEDGRAALARKLTTDALAAASEAGHHELAAYTYGMLALLHAHHLGDPYESLRLVGAGMDQAKNATGTTEHGWRRSKARPIRCSATAHAPWPHSTAPMRLSTVPARHRPGLRPSSSAAPTCKASGASARPGSAAPEKALVSSKQYSTSSTPSTATARSSSPT
jgi:hypothetical protein